MLSTIVLPYRTLIYLHRKNTILLTNFNAAFYGCGNLKTLNLSGLVHNYKDCVFSLTFEGLSQLETLNISNWIINGSPYTEWETGIFVIRGYIDSMTKLIADHWDIQMDLKNGFSLFGGEFVTPINYFAQGRANDLEISVNDWSLKRPCGPFIHHIEYHKKNQEFYRMDRSQRCNQHE